MRRALSVVVLVAWAIAACGGDGGAEADITTTAATTTTTVATTTTTAATTTTSQSVPTTMASSDEPIGDDFNPANCPELMASLASASNAAGAMAGAGIGGAEFAVDVIREWARNGPDEIRDDLTNIADAYETFVGALEEAGVDLSDPTSFANLDQAAIEEIQQASEALDTAELQRANDNITAFIERECS